MPGHKMKKDKGYTKMPGGGKGEGMMGYMGGGHHNPHGFGVENGSNQISSTLQKVTRKRPVIKNMGPNQPQYFPEVSSPYLV